MNSVRLNIIFSLVALITLSVSTSAEAKRNLTTGTSAICWPQVACTPTRALADCSLNGVLSDHDPVYEMFVLPELISPLDGQRLPGPYSDHSLVQIAGPDVDIDGAHKQCRNLAIDFAQRHHLESIEIRFYYTPYWGGDGRRTETITFGGTPQQNQGLDLN